MMWTKMEKRRITERRGGAIFKTEVVGHEWFQIGKNPQPYVDNGDGIIWVNTLDYVTSKEKPE